MKKIGLIGGISPVSTKIFYDLLIKYTREKYNKYPEIIIYSVEFNKYLDYLHNDLKSLEKVIKLTLNKLVKIGAEICLITSLSMHNVIDKIKTNKKNKLMNMFDILNNSISSNDVLVVGTKKILENEYLLKVIKNDNRNIIIPNQNEITIIQKIISEELNLGIFNDKSKNIINNIINKYSNKVNEVILACTVLPSIIKQKDIKYKVIDIVDVTCKQIVDIL